jgi:alcohol dehydrogenase class IV
MSYKDRFIFNFHISTKIVFGEEVLKETVQEGTGLPQKLSEVNVPQESLEEMVKIAVADMAMRSNMRKVTDPQEIVPVLTAAW